MRLGPSRQLALVLGTLHLGAVPCAFANDLPLAVQCLLAAAVLCRTWHCIGLHGSRRAARAIVLLIWDRHGRWRLLQRDGSVLHVRLEHGAYVHPELLILPFRCLSGRRLSVLMVPDMADADGLRRLRTRLRCDSLGDP
jgi:hypothetical protein